MADVVLQRVAVRRVVVQQLFRQPHGFRRQVRQRHQRRCIDDARIHPGLDAAVQKHRIEHLARGRLQPERDVRQPQDRAHPGKFLLDAPDGLDRFPGGVAQRPVAAADRERQRIQQQVAAPQAARLAESDQPSRDLQLAVRRHRHAGLVNGQPDQAGPEAPRQGHQRFRLLLAGLEVDRIDEHAPAVQLQRRLDHVELRAVHHQGQAAFARGARRQRRHVRPLVAAGIGHAQVQHVRHAFVLLHQQVERGVQPLGQQRVAEFLRAGGIRPLADIQRRRVLRQVHRCEQAGDLLRRRDPARRRGGRVAQTGAQTADMLGRRAAAPADDVQTHGFRDRQKRLRIGLRAQGIMDLAVHQRRQPRIRHAADEAAPLAGDGLQMPLHGLGPRRAVHAQHVNRIRLQRRHHRPDGRPHQQRPRRLHRHRHIQQLVARRSPHLHRRRDRRLDLQQVLAGLHDQPVGAALQQAAHLLLIAPVQLVERHLPQRRQARARPDGPHHKPGPPVRRLRRVRRLPRDPRRGPRNLLRPRRQSVFPQRDRRRPEAVRLHRIAARGKIRSVNVANDLRRRQVQPLVAAVVLPPRLGPGMALLDLRTHRPVHQQAPGLQQFMHRHGVSSFFPRVGASYLHKERSTTVFAASRPCKMPVGHCRTEAYSGRRI